MCTGQGCGKPDRGFDSGCKHLSLVILVYTLTQAGWHRCAGVHEDPEGAIDEHSNVSDDADIKDDQAADGRKEEPRAQLPQYSDPERGFWGEAPGTRLAMALRLCHAVLDTWKMRCACVPHAVCPTARGRRAHQSCVWAAAQCFAWPKDCHLLQMSIGVFSTFCS